MGIDLFIWKALANVKHHLSIYLKSAPEKETTYLATLLELIKLAETNALKALDEYKNLITYVNQWYSQTDLEHVDIKQALTLLHETNQFLRALETTCRGLYWPFSTQVPTTLYDDIDALLTLSAVKEAALIKQRDHDQQASPLTENKDSLHHLLNLGINTLQTKKTALAEQKQAHKNIVLQFKQLQSCLALPSSEIMEKFWQLYSTPESFELLMTLLLVQSDEEKKAWLLIHAYYRTDLHCDTFALGFFQNNISSLYQYGTRKLFGKTLTPQLLNERLANSIKQFYQKVVEQDRQTIDSTQWLTEIETTIDGCQIDPTLHELIVLQELLNEQSNDSFNFSGHSKTLNTLTLLTKSTSQKQANTVKKIRQDLQTLQASIYELQEELQAKTQAKKLLYQQIEAVKELTNNAEFSLSEVDKKKLLEQLDKYQNEQEQSFIKQLPDTLQAQVGTDNVSAIEKFQTYLQEKSVALENLLNMFNQAGEAERENALQALKSFMEQKQGIWEYILRFFSRTYCQCMVSIETTLMINETSSIEKVDTITEQLAKAHSNGGYFVRQRLTLFANHHPQGMFQPCEDTEEDNFIPPAQFQPL